MEKNLVELNKLLKQYFQVDITRKEVEQEHKALNGRVKQLMTEGEISNFVGDDFVATCKTQERVKMNEDKLIQRLKDLGHTEAIKMVEAPNQLVIDNLIYEGKLDPVELDRCIDVTKVTVLTVKGAKK